MNPHGGLRPRRLCPCTTLSVAIEERGGHLAPVRVTDAHEKDARAPLVEHVEPVTDAPEGRHAKPAAFQFRPEPRDVNVDRLWFTDEARTPGAGQDLVATQNEAFVFNQDSQQVEFARRDLNLAACDLRASRARVEPQAAGFDDCLNRLGNALSEESAQLGANQRGCAP